MKDAKEILSAYLNVSQLLEAEKVSQMFSAWQQIAGANLAAHSRIKELEKGIVYIETDHPGWIQLLKIEERRIRRALKKSFPGLGIEGVRFFLGTKTHDSANSGNSNRTGGHVLPADRTKELKESKRKAGGEAEENKEKLEKVDNSEKSERKKAFLDSIKRLEKLAEENPRD